MLSFCWSEVGLYRPRPTAYSLLHGLWPYLYIILIHQIGGFCNMNWGNAKTKESLCIGLYGGVVDRCSCRLTMSSGQHDSTTLDRADAGGRKVIYRTQTYRCTCHCPLPSRPVPTLTAPRDVMRWCTCDSNWVLYITKTCSGCSLDHWRTAWSGDPISAPKCVVRQ